MDLFSAVLIGLVLLTIIVLWNEATVNVARKIVGEFEMTAYRDALTQTIHWLKQSV